MGNFLPKDYVGVNVRIDQFHAKYPKGSITTEFKLDGNVAIFIATVTDGEWKVFNGHSFGLLGREKAFEKLETVSVGRALAFMGFETKWGIASKEEMEEFEEKQAIVEKEWFNAPQLTAFLKVKENYATGDEAVKAIRQKYALNKAMEQEVRNLY